MSIWSGHLCLKWTLQMDQSRWPAGLNSPHQRLFFGRAETKDRMSAARAKKHLEAFPSTAATPTKFFVKHYHASMSCSEYSKPKSYICCTEHVCSYKRLGNFRLTVVSVALSLLKRLRASPCFCYWAVVVWWLPRLPRYWQVKSSTTAEVRQIYFNG